VVGVVERHPRGEERSGRSRRRPRRLGVLVGGGGRDKRMNGWMDDGVGVGFGWKAPRTVGLVFLSSPRGRAGAGGPRLRRVSCAAQLCVSVTISAAWGPTTLVKVGVLIANTCVAKKGRCYN
jgi:hypothetical protein